MDLLKHNLCSFSLRYIDRFELSEIYGNIKRNDNFYNGTNIENSNQFYMNSENSNEEDCLIQSNSIDDQLIQHLVDKFYSKNESNYDEFFDRWNSDRLDYQEFRKFRKYLKKSVAPFKYVNHAELYQNIMEREFTISNDSPENNACSSLEICKTSNKFLDHYKNPGIGDKQFLSKKSAREVYDENY